VVWDRLTEQPHQHAGRFERLKNRLADAPHHLAAAGALLRAAGPVWRRYRELASASVRPFSWPGAGIGLRPGPDPAALLAEIEALGVHRILLRLHPWQDGHDAEEALARELSSRGFELTFALPQNRDLVRDPRRWEGAVEELGERFAPLGGSFQIGQAINRSKWGVWSYQEYLELAARAERILKRHPGVRILGPSVIDFEPHATIATLFLRHPEVRFDALASLLYVDRRGAPESTQLGLDARGKALLLRAGALAAPRCGHESWITEFNWPLWEGPHSPAGRDVAVDEATQADYLVRFLLLTLGTGAAQRAYWWQLVAKGYGLVDPGGGSLRRRPAFAALAHLEARLAGSISEGPLDLPEPLRGGAFRLPGGERLQVLWSRRGATEIELPPGLRELHGRDGERLSPSSGRWSLGSSPVYALLDGD